MSLQPNCINCGYSDLELVDTLHSNVNTDRAKVGQLTGEVYRCENCEELQVDNFLTGKTEPFSYLDI